MTIPDWTPEQTQQLAQGLARVEIDYRREPVRVRVVPMTQQPKGVRPSESVRSMHLRPEQSAVQGTHGGAADPEGRASVNNAQKSITAAEYRRRMGWPPV